MAADTGSETERVIDREVRIFTAEEIAWYKDFYLWRNPDLWHIPVKEPNPLDDSACHVIDQLRRVVERDRARRQG